MALDKDGLFDDLADIFENFTDSVSTKEGQMEVAIDKYLGTAEVAITGSSITFTGTSITFPVNSATSGAFEAMLTAAVTLACVAPIGNIDGTPVAPNIAIVTEIGSPPTAPVVFTMTLESVEESAQRLADAIHMSVSTILFVTTQMPPAPATVAIPLPSPIT